jgi:hypothetical protein
MNDKKILITTTTLAALALATTAALAVFAPGAAYGSTGNLDVKAHGDMAQPITSIEIAVNSDLIKDAPRATEIRRGLRDDPFPISRSEAELLAWQLANELERDLGGAGVYSPGGSAGGTRLKVTIEDVDPSRLHLTQAGFKTGDYRGERGRGGARVSATLYDASGQQLREYSMEEYAVLRGLNNQPGGAWTEAGMVMDEFSSELARDLSDKG